jgi:ubiquinone/menaquinone biosynthesis C-methylase UbiE
MDLVEHAPVPVAVKVYARTEYARGVQFHRDYVARLGMSGQRVLDAGCGVGNWSLALSQYFRQVTSLELDLDRLAFTRYVGEVSGVTLELVYGSIEDLPFAESSFDAVFCRGVIFLTDYRQSMAELTRVLKPGGMLYISFEELAWWDHLILERGATEPELVSMSCGMLSNHIADLLQAYLMTYAGQTITGKLLLAGAVALRALHSYGRLRQLKALWILRKPIWHILRRSQEAVGQAHIDIQQLRSLDRFINSIADSSERVIRFGTHEQQLTLSQDLLSFVQGKDVITIPRRGYCINREDMHDAAERFGLDVIGLSAEGAIVVNAEHATPGGVYPTNWGCAEMLVRKPDGECAWLKPSFVRANAKAAAVRFSSLIPNTIVSNAPAKTDIGSLLWRYYQSATRSINHPAALQHLVTDASKGLRNTEDRFRAVYRLTQNAVFHHPLVQLVDDEGNAARVGSVEILAAGIGRCGHAARVACDLYQAAGYQARMLQLHKHLCCEVFFDGRWRLVDADAFKAGIWLTNEEGDWATLEELRKTPSLIDRVPAIGLQLAPSADWSLGIGGMTVTGYTDVGLAWHRPYVSYLYFGGSPKSPPHPPVLSCRREGDQLVLKTHNVETGVQRVRIEVGVHSRGWSYHDYPDEGYLKRCDKSIAGLELTPEEILRGVSIRVPPTVLFVNVSSLDEYQLNTHDFWVWPGNELTI